jgi:hypothetical protein
MAHDPFRGLHTPPAYYPDYIKQVLKMWPKGEGRKWEHPLQRLLNHFSPDYCVIKDCQVEMKADRYCPHHQKSCIRQLLPRGLHVGTMDAESLLFMSTFVYLIGKNGAEEKDVRFKHLLLRAARN